MYVRVCGERLVGPWTFARTPRWTMNSAEERIAEDKCDTFKYIYLKTERTMYSGHYMAHSMPSATIPFCVPFVRESILIGQRLSFPIHTLTHTHWWWPTIQFCNTTKGRSLFTLCWSHISKTNNGHTDQTMDDGIFRIFSRQQIDFTRILLFSPLLRRSRLRSERPWNWLVSIPSWWQCGGN